MDSRERIMIALSHREPDRVPYDLGALGPSGISIQAYRNLLKYLHADEKGEVGDTASQRAKLSENFLQRFRAVRQENPSPFGRGHTPAHTRYHRDGGGNLKPNSGRGERYGGYAKTKKGVRRLPHLLGWRSGYSAYPSFFNPARGGRRSKTVHRRPCPGGWIRIRRHPGHPARDSTRKHHGHVEGAAKLRDLPWEF